LLQGVAERCVYILATHGYLYIINIYKEKHKIKKHTIKRCNTCVKALHIPPPFRGGYMHATLYATQRNATGGTGEQKVVDNKKIIKKLYFF
jgi:hypothetical protein